MPNPRLALIAGLLLAPAACTTVPPAQAADGAGFDGAWTVRWCDSGDAARECGAFSLYLVQDGERLCGEHQVATRGLSRLDEGEPGTVLGAVHGDRATVVVRATRTGARYLATLERTGDRLRWRRLGLVAAGESDEPTILPGEDTLTRDLRAAPVEHAAAVKAAPCRWPGEPAPG